MNLPLKIARRYLFAKKSTNAINIITGISIFGISIGTAALILVLSVFNGFEDLISGMYSNFNPDIKVTPIKGKSFEVDSSLLVKLRSIDGVEFVSETLEEVAFFEYKENQDFGVLKGVDEYFSDVTNIDSTVREGLYSFKNGARNMAVLGLGMRNKLGADVDEPFVPLSVYMPKREASKGIRFGSISDQQFKKRSVYPGGTFLIQQEVNAKYVLTSLNFARELMGHSNKVSALEIRMKSEAAETSVMQSITEIMGPDFDVKDRYRQEESFLKLMKMEKWLSFAIASLMVLLVAFNMVGALWMIVLEKKKDIAILKSMGALDNTVRNIFLSQGFFLSLLGVIVGFVLALSIYAVQKYFGIVSIPGDFIIEAYPISIRFFDFIIVGLTVLGIGVLASIPPALRAKRVSVLIREE